MKKRHVARAGAVIGTGLLLMLGAVAGPAAGDIITFNGTSGPFEFDGDSIPGLSAQADFELVGTELTVTLSNTSPYDVSIPAEVLTAVLFTINGDASLETVSAVLPDGSSVIHWDATNINADGSSADGTYDGDVGAEWAYIEDMGISSTGLDDIFGPDDRFDTTRDLWNPDSPDGLQYGIVSPVDDPDTINWPVTGKEPLIIGPVVFTFLASEDFSLADITGVSFQYGTSIDEPNIPVVPEPATASLLGLGVCIAALRHRKKR